VRGLEFALAAKVGLTAKPAYSTLLAEVETWIDRHAPSG